ncbi:MAG: ribonuclease R [Rhodobacteraceae bacterium]|nr:ribonuclease R [Paracoccaceae bacterium]
MTKLPQRADILEWIAQHPMQRTERDITKAFCLKGATRVELKKLLEKLKQEGVLEKDKKSYQNPDVLPPVTLLRISHKSEEGYLFANAPEWVGPSGEPEIIMVLRPNDKALSVGDKVLARVQLINPETDSYEARVIRKLGVSGQKVLGIFRIGPAGARIIPIEKSGKEWRVQYGYTQGAKDGELVEAERKGPSVRLGLPQVQIVARLGDPSQPKTISLIAMHQHNIPDDFPKAVLREAEQDWTISDAGREDLRELPFITIDPPDARDHDDACYAAPDDDPNNQGGYIIWVAIADVAHYVRPGTALDKEALNRGNSTYFPDRVAPMLPDHLSGDLCSLHEGVDRFCIAVKMKIDTEGRKLSHSFHRGIMRSAASLSYEQVQSAFDGKTHELAGTLLNQVIIPIYHAYHVLLKEREKRQPLALDLPERQIELSENGTVTAVKFKDRLDSNRLIEEFMILANVAAAETLSTKKKPLLFRVHEQPAKEKLDALRETAQSCGLVLAKGQVLKTSHINALLTAARDIDQSELINMSTLRAMSQAYYNPENIGHFGLALRSYAHFTSPIRRYADLIVHRSLISAHAWKDDGLTYNDVENLPNTAEQISHTERRSMMAERDTVDRYLAAYLSERKGVEFTGRISGVVKFGVFVRIDETGAEGLVPIRRISREFFHYKKSINTLQGSETGFEVTLGQPVLVRLVDTMAEAGGITFDLLEVEGKAPPSGTGRQRITKKAKYKKAKGRRLKVSDSKKKRR